MIAAFQFFSRDLIKLCFRIVIERGAQFLKTNEVGVQSPAADFIPTRFRYPGGSESGQ